MKGETPPKASTLRYPYFRWGWFLGDIWKPLMDSFMGFIACPILLFATADVLPNALEGAQRGDFISIINLHLWLFLREVAILSPLFYGLPRLLWGIWLVRFIGPSIGFRGIKVEEDGLELIGWKRKIEWNEIVAVEQGEGGDILHLVRLINGQKIPLGFFVFSRYLPSYKELLSLIVQRKGKLPVSDALKELQGTYEYPEAFWWKIFLLSTLLFAYFHNFFFIFILLPGFAKLMLFSLQTELPVTLFDFFPNWENYKDLITSIFLFLIVFIIGCIAMYLFSIVYLIVKDICPMLFPRSVEIKPDRVEIKWWRREIWIPIREVKAVHKDILLFKWRDFALYGTFLTFSRNINLFNSVAILSIMKKKGG